MRFSIIVLICVLLLTPVIISAQNVEVPESIDLSISMVPENPKPLSNVMIEVKSFSIDLNLANLSWNYSGKIIANSIGKTRMTVTAPASGQTALITVTASNPGIDPVSASILLHPGSIDMLWEAIDSYTPPFYKGKALLSRSGAFKVTAIASVAAPSGISFTWSRNGGALPGASGYGKSSIVLLNTILNARETIGVSAAGGLFEGSGSISLAPGVSSVVAYQKKEGFIDYANGKTSDIELTGPGAVLRFEPFFFSVPHNLANDLSFDMKFGEESVYEDPANELAITRPADSGVRALNLGISTTSYSLQNLTRTFNIFFK